MLLLFFFRNIKSISLKLEVKFIVSLIEIMHSNETVLTATRIAIFKSKKVLNFERFQIEQQYVIGNLFPSG